MGIRRSAVTLGRFAVVTRAHLAMVEEILESWDHVTVGVLDSAVNSDLDIPTDLRDFYEQCDHNWRAEKNPYDVEQRLAMWRNVVLHSDLSDRVEVRRVSRPEYYPVEFAEQFPAADIDLVLAKIGAASDFDRVRHEAFRRILGRMIYPVVPSSIMHVTDIRNSSDADLDAFLAPGCLELLKEMELSA